MSKKKGIPVLLIIVLLVSLIAVIFLFVNLIFCSTCFPTDNQEKLPAAVQVPNGRGIVPESRPDYRPVYSDLEEAEAGFSEIPGLFKDDTGHYHIYYIQGQNLDDTGKAAKWVFEMQSIAGTEMRVYDRNGWAVIPWNVTHDSGDINIDTIISPSALFNQSRPLLLERGLLSSSQTRDIELRDSEYTLTVSSANNSTIMRFNAVTGALIE